MKKKYIFEETGFENYVNTYAKVVIVGVTPGKNQVGGKDEGLTPHDTKKKYAFNGKQMRSNLVAMLDLIGVNKVLEIQSCESIWDNDFKLVEMTYLLKRGTFEIKDGKLEMFNKADRILGNPQLKEELNNGFVQDCALYLDAKLFVACGFGVYKVLHEFKRCAIIKVPIVGIAHPSGLNGNWVNCYLKKKQADSETLKRCEKMRNDAISQIESLINI